MDRRMGRGAGGRAGLPLAVALALPVAAAACAGYTPDEYALSPEAEAELGDPMAERLDRELPLVGDAAIVIPVRDVGLGLAGASARGGGGFSFRIVDRPSVNAFSLPGGHVYVNRGLLRATKNMSEVAGVLSHEIAHVVAGHTAERLLQSRRVRLGHTVSDPRSDRSAALFHAHYHRIDETEADSLAVEIMLRAGWDPAGLLTFFQSMQWLRDHRGDNAGGPFFSHPTLEERMEAVRRITARIPDERRRELRRFTAEYDALREALDPGPRGEDGEGREDGERRRRRAGSR